MEPTTHVIADEWRARADELARWAMESLVNRRDVWGQYVPVSQRKTSATGRMMNALTLPARDQRGGNDMVTLDKLARHFRAAQPGHVIGLHSSTADNTSRWFAIDVDLHEPDDDDAANIANLNFRAAVAWWKALQGRGLDPLLFDSNGAGGYHIWVLLDKPYPTDHVRAFAVDIVSDYESRGFKKRPEVFPKRAQPAGDKIGSWLRLPGRHHTRDHFSRVWSGDEWLDTRGSRGRLQSMRSWRRGGFRCPGSPKKRRASSPPKGARSFAM